MTFEDVEKRFYSEWFENYLDAYNAGCRRNNNYNRIKTMDDYRKAERTCPEETIFTLGDNTQSVDPAELLAVTREFLEWRKKTFPNCVTLDAALHVDEPNAAPHVHVRQVWVAWDENKGCNCVNQTKAFQQMGVERPSPEKAKSRYNNPKQTYTMACFEQLKQIAREHGIEIEEQPRERSKSGRQLEELKAQTAEARATEAEQKLADAEARATEAEQYMGALVSIAKQELDELEQKTQSVRSRVYGVEKEVKGIEKELDDRCGDLERALKACQEETPKAKGFREKVYVYTQAQQDKLMALMAEISRIVSDHHKKIQAEIEELIQEKEKMLQESSGWWNACHKVVYKYEPEPTVKPYIPKIDRDESVPDAPSFDDGEPEL
jgi:hypothetical protein